MKPIVFCPWCSHPDRGPQRHFSDAGDDDMKVKCGVCGKQYTILKRIITVEYSVKDVR